MAALTQDRNTPERMGGHYGFPVAASTVIYGGGIGCLNSSGYAVPGSTATGLIAVGRAEKRVDNSAGADGDVFAEFKRGVFRFDNSAAADEITLADVGSDCYIVDDQTVAKTDGSSSRSVAGKVRDVEAAGVWVEI